MAEQLTPEGVEIPPGWREGDRRLPFGTKKKVELRGKVHNVRVGYCSCRHCPHTYSWECDPANDPDATEDERGESRYAVGCLCCSELCT